MKVVNQEAYNRECYLTLVLKTDVFREVYLYERVPWGQKKHSRTVRYTTIIKNCIGFFFYILSMAMNVLVLDGYLLLLFFILSRLRINCLPEISLRFFNLLPFSESVFLNLSLRFGNFFDFIIDFKNVHGLYGFDFFICVLTRWKIILRLV